MMSPLVWEIPLIVALIGVGFCVRLILERMKHPNADTLFSRIFKSNREFDGSVFTVVLLFCFLLLIILTYRSKEFAELSTTAQILEIIKLMFSFMAGYLFRKVGEPLPNGDADTKQETDQK